MRWQLTRNRPSLSWNEIRIAFKDETEHRQQWPCCPWRMAIVFLLAGGCLIPQTRLLAAIFILIGLCCALKHGSAGAPFAPAAPRRGCNRQTGSSVASTW